MMKNKRIVLSIFLLIFSIICSFSQNSEAELIEKHIATTGKSFQRIREGFYLFSPKAIENKKPKAGDFVLIEYRSTLLSGKCFDSTQTQPLEFQVGYNQVIKAWDYGVTLLSEGSQAEIICSSPYTYGSVGVGTIVPGGVPLHFRIKLLKVMSADEYDQYMKDLEAAQKLQYEKEVNSNKVLNTQQIREFCLSRGLEPLHNEEGLNWIITKNKKQPRIQPGNQVEILYEGYLTDGKLFEQSSAKGKSFKFLVGRKKVIEGLDEGIRYFGKGDEGWILIPAHLAYSSRSISEKDITIPAYSVLCFKISVKDVK